MGNHDAGISSGQDLWGSVKTAKQVGRKSLCRTNEPASKSVTESRGKTGIHAAFAAALSGA